MPSVKYSFDLKEPLRTYALEVLEEQGKDKPKDLGLWVQGRIVEWRKGHLVAWYTMQALGYGEFPNRTGNGKTIRVELSDCRLDQFTIADKDGGEFFFTMSERFQERLLTALSVQFAQLKASEIEDLSEYTNFDRWLQRFIDFEVAGAKAKLEQDEDDEELKASLEQKKKEEAEKEKQIEEAKKAAEKAAKKEGA